MALQPGNTSFVPGDLLTAQQYNITHNTVNKLAIEDNSRVVYPGSFPPANIASGHWVIAALAGNYSNYPGITSTSVLSPSVLVYDSSINEWDVYPLSGIGDSTISIYNPSIQYKINDIVIYNDIDSVLPEYRYEYIYRCKEIAFPDQSPESTPSKWARQGLYIDVDAITALIASLDSRLTLAEIELTNKVNISLLGANNGVATLDNQGKILISQLPSLLINNTYVVNSEAEMLALTAVKSDIAVRTDIEKTFILADIPASNINNWIEVLASYDRVISVNGLGGIVTLTTSNIPEGSNLYFSDSRVNNNTNVAANTAKRHDQVTVGTANGLLLNDQELSLKKASITETGALSSEDWLTFNNKQDIILQGPVDSYYRGDKTWQTLNTASVVETTNLYFTQSRVLNTSIGNFIEIDVAITAGDSIATALNKLQTQVNNRIATVSKEQIEAVLTGNITSHAHDIYLTDAPIDNKQYARKDGSWVEVQEGGGPGTIDHSLLTPESRALPDQHPIESITGLSTSLSDLSGAISLEEFNRQQGDSGLSLAISAETSNRESAISAEILARQNADLLLQSNIDAESIARIAKDDSLQDQILTMQENNPVAQIRYLTSDPIVLNTETFYQSKADKGTSPAFEITTLVTATSASTANIVGQWVGIALTQPLELIDQITSLLIKARRARTTREITLFAEFYDYTSAGVKTLKGTSSQVVLTNTTTAYDLYFPIQAYLAAIGSRGLIVVKAFQNDTDPSADAILVIEGDYYSRWSYTLPAGSLSFLDDKVISSQDLPAIGSLTGETQKQVNGKLDTEISKERIFFAATSPDFGVVTRDYNFKVVAATITTGTLTLQTSSGATYTLNTSVTAGDYIKVLSDTVNSRAFLKINKA